MSKSSKSEDPHDPTQGSLYMQCLLTFGKAWFAENSYGFPIAWTIVKFDFLISLVSHRLLKEVLELAT